VRNDDEVETLVKPTEALLRATDELGTPFTIFIDLISVWRYAEFGPSDFVAAVNAQLVDAVQRGHDVQTHIHPHWLHATRDGARWRFDSKYFLLGNFRDEDEVHRLTRDLLVRAKEYLEGLLRPVAPAYRTVAYRAGGYGIQPGESGRAGDPPRPRRCRLPHRQQHRAGHVDGHRPQPHRFSFGAQPVQLLSLARRGPGAGSRPRCNRMR
jgi:hypothetical protein